MAPSAQLPDNCTFFLALWVNFPNLWVIVGNYPYYSLLKREMGTQTFTGEFRYSIDSKGRLNIPAKFRKALPETSEDTFVVTRGLDKNIIAYSLDKWQQIEEDLLKLSPRLPEHRAYKRQATRFAMPLKFDSQGRVVLPANLLEIAGIEKDVVIIGMIDEIEIWDPDILKRYEENEFQLDAEDIEAIDNYTRSP